MSANRWTEIKYNRVSSVSMKNNTDSFFKHDPDWFQRYLIQVESGRKKISGATLLPHELIAEAFVLSCNVSSDPNSAKFPALMEAWKLLSETKLRAVEAQWKTLIQRLRKSGSLENAIAICDVSGSMGSISQKLNKRVVLPIFPSVALSLVLAHLGQPLFNGGFITFSANPQFVQLDLTQPLAKIANDLNNADWGMNTDLHTVFLKLLLPLAVRNKVKQEDMIKRLFIFSDMQFDESAGTDGNASNWQTNYDVIEKAYVAAGYEVPQIVYWDLSTHESHWTVETQADRRGVAMMNGFSPAMLKVFMGEEEEGWESIREDGHTKAVAAEEFNPMNVMKKALMNKSFDGLVVVD
jgi:hypothetical protein